MEVSDRVRLVFVEWLRTHLVLRHFYVAAKARSRGCQTCGATSKIHHPTYWL
jgi:hypothetical protein